MIEYDKAGVGKDYSSNNSMLEILRDLSKVRGEIELGTRHCMSTK